MRSRIKDLEERYKGKQVIIGVDRLDYIKGLTQKLKGFDMFLDDHPELREKVVLMQVTVPSREDVKEYKELETELSTITGKINGKHGRTPFSRFAYNHVDRRTSYAKWNPFALHAPLRAVRRTNGPLLYRGHLPSNVYP